jgi:hypothetical protein
MPAVRITSSHRGERARSPPVSALRHPTETAGPAHSRDSGLAGCAALSGARQLTASDYEKIGVQFADSRWPDLRFSGVAYAEMASTLLHRHAYGGEGVWFYERLADACAAHARALPFWPA